MISTHSDLLESQEHLDKRGFPEISQSKRNHGDPKQSDFQFQATSEIVENVGFLAADFLSTTPRVNNDQA